MSEREVVELQLVIESMPTLLPNHALCGKNAYDLLRDIGEKNNALAMVIAEQRAELFELKARNEALLVSYFSYIVRAKKEPT